mgnify:CR=1 FL=1
MLTRTDKEGIVQKIQDDMGKAQAIFVTNLVGIPSNDSVKIRKDVRDAKGKIVIARNSLLRMAAKGTQLENLVKGLKGPHAFAFAFGDAVGVAKALYEAAKEFEPLALKGGILDGKQISSKEIETLAKLPSRDQMLATLLATFNAPISAFVRVLDAVRVQKEKEA